MRKSELKTFSHLAKAKKMPSDYEIASTDLLYYVTNPTELNLPINEWYRKHQKGAAIQCFDFSVFADPLGLTYTKYVEMQAKNDIFLEQIFSTIDQSQTDKELPEQWVHDLELIVPPARYLFHAMQMIAAYIGSMVPASRATLVFMFQAANEMKRTQVFARRMHQLHNIKPNFGSNARFAWENHPNWQEMRRYIELLLTTYDWTEAFVALNYFLKPRVDTLLVNRLAATARSFKDTRFSEALSSLSHDTEWTAAWSSSLLELMLSADQKNKDVFEQICHKWLPLSQSAGAPLEQLFSACQIVD